MKDLLESFYALLCTMIPAVQHKIFKSCQRSHSHLIGSDAGLDVLGKLQLVTILVFLAQHTHVNSHGASEQRAPELLCVQFLLLLIVPYETLHAVGRGQSYKEMAAVSAPALPVRNLDPAIHDALHRRKHPVASGGPGESNVQIGPEWPGTIVSRLDIVVLASHVYLAFVRVSEA